MLGAIGSGTLDPRLQMALGNVLGAWDVPRPELLGLAHVDEHRAVVDLLVDDGRIDLVDLALDASEELST
jgi:hypothetical protein